MKFAMTVTGILASLAIAIGPAAAAYAGRQDSIRAGNDVSFPQCGGKFRSGQAFGIVAVNAGRADTTNPCLAAEIRWAQTSSGAARQPKASLYVNTADPGNRRVADWPADNKDPVTDRHVTDPYGTCEGRRNQACAWQYGWNMADLDAQTRGVRRPRRYRWWLDVEMANSWQSSTKDNRADLEGMASYFRRIGVTVGVYSTAWQWASIVGAVGRPSPLYRMPDWIPGARTLFQATQNCHLAPLTGGGTVILTQWTTKPADSDFSCRSRPRRGKAGYRRRVGSGRGSGIAPGPSLINNPRVP